MSSSEDYSTEEKPKKQLIQPISTPLKRKKSEEEEDQPKKKKMKQELRELKKDQEESLFYTKEKRHAEKPNKKPKHSEKSTKISKPEIFPDSNRTPQSMKTKFNTLRSDAAAKFSGMPQEKVETYQDALDFIKPSLVSSADDFYLVFSKRQWSSIKLGFKGQQLRFLLTQTRRIPDSPLASAEFDGHSSFVHVMDIEENFEIGEPYEDDFYKGYKLKLRPLKALKDEDDDWNMS